MSLEQARSRPSTAQPTISRKSTSVPQKRDKSHLGRAILAVVFICSLCLPIFLSGQLPVQFSTLLEIKDNRSLCPHVILFTQARHGSTWFLDSVERCRYSRTEQVEPSVYGKRVFLDTELWHVYGKREASKLQSVMPDEVVNYLQSNCSVKLFPPALQRKGHMIRQLFRAGRGVVPFVLLTRELKDAYLSYGEAEKSGVWAQVRRREEFGRVKKRHSYRYKRVEMDRKFQEFTFWTNKFFKDLRRLFAEERISYDEFDYDDIKDKKWIYLKGFDCFVKNCNFP